MAEEKEEKVIAKWNPLGFIDGILQDWFALPAVRDVIPSPGDIARAVLGPNNTLDALGAEFAKRFEERVKRR